MPPPPSAYTGGREETVVAESDSLSPEEEAAALLPPPPPRYDLPPGSRRLLTRVGVLDEFHGGLDAGAFGTRGDYLTRLLDGIEQPIVSRWGFVLLRRALLTSADTPPNVNGADFVAARAQLLLRQGEAIGARWLVQSVDVDRASPRLKAAAFDAALATGDPALACPWASALSGSNGRWGLLAGMCSAMQGETGPASAAIERARRRQGIGGADLKLAEKVIGAGVNSRRSAIVRWDGVSSLNPWRFGLAVTTGAPIPASTWERTPAAIKGWAVQSPMLSVGERLALAPTAALLGTLSSSAWPQLVSLAVDQRPIGVQIDAGEPDRDNPVAPPLALDEAAQAQLGQRLRTAYAGRTYGDRLGAIAALFDAHGYAGAVLTAQAAARIPPASLRSEEVDRLLTAMFAGGLDRNALGWVEQTRGGTLGWGLLAVGSPRPLATISARQISSFEGSDDSSDRHRTRLLAAALTGLGRLDPATARDVAEEYELALGTDARWSRAIVEAADRGERGVVATLVAVGLQGRDWAGVPPYHLYHITRALTRVGLEGDARMIAAEAVSRG